MGGAEGAEGRKMKGERMTVEGDTGKEIINKKQ
jgi:hypothetical protein